KDDHLPVEEPTKDLQILSCNTHTTIKNAFGILGEQVWMIKFENTFDISKILQNYDVCLNTNHMEIFERLNMRLFNSYKDMEALNELEYLNKNQEYNQVCELFDEKPFKWQIISLYGRISLQVYKWELIHEIIDTSGAILYGCKILNNNDIAILTTKGLLIYHFNKYDKSI